MRHTGVSFGVHDGVAPSSHVPSTPGEQVRLMVANCTHTGAHFYVKEKAKCGAGDGIPVAIDSREKNVTCSTVGEATHRVRL